jgi:hypothetical protein
MLKMFQKLYDQTQIFTFEPRTPAEMDSLVHFDFTCELGSKFERRLKRWKINMQCSEIYMQCSAIYMQCSVIYMQCSVIYMQCSVIYMQCSVIYMQCSVICIGK